MEETGERRVERATNLCFTDLGKNQSGRVLASLKGGRRGKGRIGYRSSLVLKRSQSPMAACKLPRASRSLYGPPRPPSPTTAPTPKRQGKQRPSGRLQHALARPPNAQVGDLRSVSRQGCDWAGPGALA